MLLNLSKKQNKLLHTILQQKLFSCSLLYFCKKKRLCAYLLKTLFSYCFTSSFFSNFIDSCPYCGRSDTDIGRGSSVTSSRFISFLVISFHFFQGFLFFYFFMILCFSCLLFDVILYSFLSCFHLFLSSLRVSNFFVFPLFNQKISSCFISSFSICCCSDFSMSSSFFQRLLFHLFLNLFFHTKNLSLLLCTCFSLFFCFVFFNKLFASPFGLSCVLFCRCLLCFASLFLLVSVPSLFF